MEKKQLPIGVKIAMIIDIIFAAGSVIGLLIMAIGLLESINTEFPLEAQGIKTLGVVVFIFGLFMTAFTIWVIINLRKLNPSARTGQIIISIIGLLGIPIGTVIHGVILYFMFRQDTKEAFGISPAPK